MMTYVKEVNSPIPADSPFLKNYQLFVLVPTQQHPWEIFTETSNYYPVC